MWRDLYCSNVQAVESLTKNIGGQELAGLHDVSAKGFKRIRTQKEKQPYDM